MPKQAPSNLGEDFYPKLVKMCQELGMKPEDLVAVMISESGMNSSAGAGSTGASGLIQFMPSTLKGVGYHGTAREFRQKSGVEQLEYIKRYIQDKMSLIGGPFKSAAQYYMANFWPIALKLPGVKNEDPNTIFIERNPERIGKWSKKYKDVGVDVYADFEASAYKQNPLFDKDKKGYITYGDMINQVNINKKNPLYSQALAAMQEVGYAATKDTAVAENDNDISKTIKNYNPDEKSMWDQISGKTRPSQNKPGVKPVAGPVAENDSGIMSTIEKYLHLAASLEKSNKSLYKKYLPHNNIIIKINSNNYTNSVEFGRVLCSILDEELMSKSFVHTDGKNIEVECSIPGPSNNCLNIVKQLTSAAQEAFEEATLKIGGVEVKSSFIMDKKSSYQPINLKIALQQYDTFTRKFS